MGREREITDWDCLLWLIDEGSDATSQSHRAGGFLAHPRDRELLVTSKVDRTQVEAAAARLRRQSYDGG